MDLETVKGKIEFTTSFDAKGVKAVAASLQGLAGDLKKAGVAAAEGAAKSQAFKDSLAGMEKAGRVAADGLKMAAIGIGAITAAAVGLGAVAINAAADFEQGMSNIGAVSGATATEMKQIHDLALQLGKDTAFSASEASAGIEELIKGGVSIPDVMNGAAQATLNLAAAGGVGLADAAEIAANALAMFNLKGEQTGHVADLVAGAANASSLSVMDFKLSMAAAGAVANTVGFGVDDLSVAIAEMGAAGIKGSDAGTSLKTMFLNLQPTTKDQIGLFRELGILTEDGANKFFDASGSIKDLASVQGILSDALGGMTDQQRTAYLEVMFGSDAIRAGAVLTKQGAEGYDKMAAAMGKVTAASVGAAKMDNLKGSLQALSGSVETAAIMVGEALLPVLRSLVDAANTALGSAIGPLGDALSDITASAEFKAAIDAISETLSGLFSGALQSASGMIVDFSETMFGTDDPIAGLKQGLQDLAEVLTGETGPATIDYRNTLGMLPEDDQAAIKSGGEFKDKLLEIKDGLSEAKDAILPLLEKLGEFAKWAIANGPTIAKIAIAFAALGVVAQVATTIMGLVSAVSALSTVFGLLAGSTVAIGGVLLGPLTLAIAGAIAAVLLLKLAFDKNFLGLKDTVTAAGKYLSGILDKWKKWLGDLQDDVKNKDWGKLGQDIIVGIALGIIGSLRFVTDALSNLINGAISNIQRMFGVGGSETGPPAGGGGAPPPPGGGKGGGTPGERFIPPGMGLPGETVRDSAIASLVSAAQDGGTMFVATFAAAMAAAAEDILDPATRAMMDRLFDMRENRPDFEGQWEDLWSAFFDTGADSAGSFADIMADFFKMPTPIGFTQEDYQEIANAGIHFEEWVASTVKERTELDGLVSQMNEARRAAKDLSLTSEERARAIEREGDLFAQISDRMKALAQNRADWLDSQLQVWEDKMKDLEWHRSRDSVSGRQEGDLERINHTLDIIKDLKAADKARNDALLMYIDQQKNRVDALNMTMKDWAEEYAALQDMLSDRIKARQEAERDGEEDKHDLVEEMIDTEDDRLDEAHDREMARIKETMDAEKARHDAAMDALDAEAEAIQSRLDLNQAGIDEMQYQYDLLAHNYQPAIDDAEQTADYIESQIDAALETAEAAASIWDKLERIDRRDSASRRQAARTKANEVIGLSPEQIAALQGAAGAEGAPSLGTREQRVLALLGLGKSVNADEVEALLKKLGLLTADGKPPDPEQDPRVLAARATAKAQRDIADAMKEELARRQEMIAEAQHLQKILEHEAQPELDRIAAAKLAEDGRHDARMDALEAEKTFEERRYDFEADQIERMRKLEDKRHKDRMQQIDEQYARELLMLGHTAAEAADIIAKQKAEAARIAKEAREAYEEARRLAAEQGGAGGGAGGGLGSRRGTRPIGPGTGTNEYHPGIGVLGGRGTNEYHPGIGVLGSRGTNEYHPGIGVLGGAGVNEYHPGIGVLGGELVAALRSLVTILAPSGTGSRSPATAYAASGGASQDWALTIEGDVILGDNKESRLMLNFLNGRLP